MTDILWCLITGFLFGFCAGFIARGDNHAGAIRALAEMSFNEQLAAYKLRVEELKALLKRCKYIVRLVDCITLEEFNERDNVLQQIDEVLNAKTS